MAVPSFRVLWSSETRRLLKMMKSEATLAVRIKLIETVRWFQDQLCRDPLNVGEVYKLKGSVAQHLAVKDLLAVDFAVDQAHGLVLVRSCGALSGHGLDDF